VNNEVVEALTVASGNGVLTTLLIIFLLWFGGFFLMVAALGMLVLPDVFQRMHAMTKAGTLGVVSLVLGVALYHGDAATTLPAVLIIGFFLITAPIAGHMIGRAAYHRGAARNTPLVCDQYADSLAAKPDTGQGAQTAQASELDSNS